ncbi:uncharacterized protein PHALS_07184 [Plasmopara halstedii]|uniref:Uncharacterized protein n=1 Tax=Plasmopara halstedii TaxID=4781 RepID=A0A0P1B4I7_PLAHL|nr:uncharacterized protein PHALS_07184 [Plasmopara halstedii]CEG49420.1 hypothetical protein PHALS_07184 [Plasmopara halstedii]|eukprot:XP_024585789.1 hypothetical protein PHALS_07184 [Plasmopara halstedii]
MPLSSLTRSPRKKKQPLKKQRSGSGEKNTQDQERKENEFAQMHDKEVEPGVVIAKVKSGEDFSHDTSSEWFQIRDALVAAIDNFRRAG